ncbi:hypothetical protein [Streptomyces sp. t39]|uniref:hypothetical protein n=1 Tax=Streptomyces sp. t39 TaxID=1828156 RepID=UPI0011CDD55A|nr:hypothetical protein [Streptomyces sp. t39]TXS50150.1 hypothetical protein EAO77_27970 [Streptomyces sp. t39]
MSSSPARERLLQHVGFNDAANEGVTPEQLVDDAISEALRAYMAVADREHHALKAERDQYAAAIREQITQMKHTAYVWSQTLPDMISTAEVVQALGAFSPRPLPENLRDDLWQRIAGAYYLRFENDGHSEDSTAAADEALNIIKPELDRLRAELDQARRQVAAVRNLHTPVLVNGKPWCDACSVRRSTGPRTSEWVAFIPHPCPTLDALDPPTDKEVNP